jgi:hypothetical protein
MSSSSPVPERDGRGEGDALGRGEPRARGARLSKRRFKRTFKRCFQRSFKRGAHQQHPDGVGGCRAAATAARARASPASAAQGTEGSKYVRHHRQVRLRHLRRGRARTGSGPGAHGVRAGRAARGTVRPAPRDTYAARRGARTAPESRHSGARRPGRAGVAARRGHVARGVRRGVGGGEGAPCQPRQRPGQCFIAVGSVQELVPAIAQEIRQVAVRPPVCRVGWRGASEGGGGARPPGRGGRKGRGGRGDCFPGRRESASRAGRPAEIARP